MPTGLCRHSVFTALFLIRLHHLNPEESRWTLVSPPKLAATSYSSLGSLFALGDLQCLQLVSPLSVCLSRLLLFCSPAAYGLISMCYKRRGTLCRITVNFYLRLQSRRVWETRSDSLRSSNDLWACTQPFNVQLFCWIYCAHKAGIVIIRHCPEDSMTLVYLSEKLL